MMGIWQNVSILIRERADVAAGLRWVAIVPSDSLELELKS